MRSAALFATQGAKSPNFGWYKCRYNKVALTGDRSDKIGLMGAPITYSLDRHSNDKARVTARETLSWFRQTTSTSTVRCSRNAGVTWNYICVTVSAV
jgi:hypothetical protein